jgi:hypothetical protein
MRSWPQQPDLARLLVDVTRRADDGGVAVRAQRVEEGLLGRHGNGIGDAEAGHQAVEVAVHVPQGLDLGAQLPKHLHAGNFLGFLGLGGFEPFGCVPQVDVDGKPLLSAGVLPLRRSRR